jgi:hypothetical protein
MGWVFDSNARLLLIGVVVDTGEAWVYRPFSPEDHLTLPTPIARLVHTLRRYLDEGAPDQS